MNLRIAVAIVVILVVAALVLRPFVRRRIATTPHDSTDVMQDDRFVAAVTEHFKSKGVNVYIEGGVANAPKYVDGKDHHFGLRNLAQQCLPVPPHDWGRIVSEHFEKIASITAEQSRLLSDLSNFEAVKKLLGVQIWNKVDVPLDQIVHREDLPGTVTTLIFELPSSTKAVTLAEAGAWGRSQDELFGIAFENQRRKPRPQPGEIQSGAGSFFAIVGSDITMASYALTLHDFPEATGIRGALVTIPTGQYVFCLPLSNNNAAQASRLLVLLTREYFAAGPGSITDRVYWYHDGKFTEIRTEGFGDHFTLVAPNPLRDILSQ